MKYIRFGEYNSIVIFPEIVQHKEFMYLEPKSAGFCYIKEKEIVCFGESISLRLTSHEKDSNYATKQYFTHI